MANNSDIFSIYTLKNHHKSHQRLVTAAKHIQLQGELNNKIVKSSLKQFGSYHPEETSKAQLLLHAPQQAPSTYIGGKENKDIIVPFMRWEY